ncbi:hypothetical protein GCM10027048_31230 [Hymenobacter coalescens]
MAARPAPATYRVQVVEVAAFRQWLQQRLPGAVLQASSNDGRLFTVRGVPDAAALAACPQVQFVDVADRRAQPEKEIDGVDLGANRLWPVHSLYPQLTGQGLTASVKEEAFDPNDLDFRGRVVSSPLFGSPGSDHATTMATLIGGAGNSAPTGRGAARQVRLATSSYANLLPDDGAQLAAANVSVQNHSYGVAAVESYYGLEARAYDQQTRQYPSLLHVFSSGNQGNRTGPTGSPYAAVAGVANLTGQFKQSKNTLSVGATDALGRVAALSSRGPAHDGRIKPELVAIGEAGTSDAAAVVSGAAVLVQHAYRDGHSGALPPAALVKAALLNSADDAGRPGPDFEAGFGQTDALGAVQTVLDNRFVLGAATAGSTRSFPLTVPAGVRQLKLTLVWADAEAAAGVGQALVNDLDVELVGPGGQRWRPWVLSAAPHADSLVLPARRGVDRLNNVEQVTLAAPAAGSYQIQVRTHRLAVGADQPFAVAYELEAPGFTWSNPAGANTVLRADQAQRLRWQWLGPAVSGQLEYCSAPAAAWRIVNPRVDLAAGIYAWTPPADEATAQAQVRLVVGTTTYASSTFALNRPPVLRVGYNCPAAGNAAGEALLTWSAISGATQYQVWQLGAQQLEPLATITDTILLLSGSQLASRYYAVQPVLPGGGGVRGRTIDYTSAGTACYVQSFLPRQFVTSEVLFDLVLGTTYQLRRVDLERETATGFQTVQTLTAGLGTQLLLSDQLPTAGLYRYRARLETATGRSIYTQLEAIQYAQPGDVLVFPNPVPAGQTATVLDAAQRPLRWQLYDQLGRLVGEASPDPSALNELDTRSLRAGTYILRIQPEGSSTVIRRIVVQ